MLTESKPVVAINRSPRVQMLGKGNLFLRSMYLRALRESRWAIVGWGIFGAILIGSQVSVFPTDPVARASFVANLQKFAVSFQFLGDPVGLDTFGGYVTWRSIGFFPIFLGIWALLAGSALVRGDEQRGRVDVLLSLPISRYRFVLARALAYATAVGLSLLLAWALSLAIVGRSVLASDYPAGPAAIVMLNTAVTTLLFGALALLLSQLFSTRRTAASITGVVLAVAYFGNNFAASSDVLKALQVINPLYYYSLSKPLVLSAGTNWAALLGMAVTCVLMTMVAAWLFVHRDIGQRFVFGSSRSAATATAANVAGLNAERASKDNPVAVLARARSPWLSNVFAETLRDMRSPILYWGIGTVVYSWFVVSTAKSSQSLVENLIGDNEFLRKLVGGDLGLNGAYLSYAIFTFLPIFLAFYAVTIVASWSGDQDEGRLEVLLTTPVARWHVLVARLAAAGVALALVLAGNYLMLLISGAVYDFRFDTGNAVVAMALIWPLVMAVVAFGFLLASFLKQPLVAVSITGSLVGVFFFLNLLGPALNLPDAVMNVSPFVLYGQPILHGFNAFGQVVLVVEAIIFSAACIRAFQKRDIVK